MRFPLWIPSLLLLVTASLHSQRPDKAILKFESSAYNLAVTNKNQLVIATRAGEVAFAPSITDYWIKSDIVPKNKLGFSPGVLIDNAIFFNADTGFVSGFINNGKGKYNIIYHTVDHGANWKAVDFGQDGWVDNATSLDNGEAWLSVAGSGIAYTKDYGLTWKFYAIPEKKQRFTSIYINTERHGIIGSLWNMLAITTNNCETWTLLPTPLDQKKYTKTDISHRPEISKVAMLKNYLLVKQDGLLFYSSKDSINWKFLPQYEDFYTDPQNSALFFKTKTSDFVKADEKLSPVFTFLGPFTGYTASCKNASLYILGVDRIFHLKQDNSFETRFIYSNQPADIEPVAFGYCNKGTFGALDNQIYLQTDYKGDWKHQFDLPFIIDSGSICLADNNRLLVTRKDSLLYYSMVSGKVESITKADRKEGFLKSGIEKIIFEYGSRGCFHHFSDRVTYERNGNEFVTEGVVATGTEHSTKLVCNQEIIDADLVKEFATIVLFDSMHANKIADLEFSDKDYEQCKIDVLKFKEAIKSKKTKNLHTAFQFNQNNLDFNRLTALVDSVKTIDPRALTAILSSLSELYSTTTNWVRVSLVNYNGETMNIDNLFDEPNAFYFPWNVSLDGMRSSTTNIRINQLLNEAYPGFLKAESKLPILHTIIKQLY
jgi:hypothetical protein